MSDKTIPSGAAVAGLSRRRLLMSSLAGAGGLGAASLLAACSSNGTSAANIGNFASHPKWKFVFVNHVTTNPFFVPTIYGIEDMESVLGVDHQWTGSQNSSVTEMVDAMNSAIAAKVAGIAVAIIDQAAFNDPVSRALDAGIPVVAYNADAPAASNNKRLAYIGQDLFASGQAMGRRIASLVDSGKVVIFIATPGALNIQPRADGAKAAIAASGKKIQIDVIATGAQVTDELNAVDAYYQGHKTIKGMFAVDAGSTQSVAQVMDKYNLIAQGVKGGGFDLQPKTIELVQKGVMDFTIDQQPYLQGAYSLVELFMAKISGGLIGPADCSTGLLFVTKDNVGKYIKNKDRFEGSAKEQKVISA
jgi:simple sugar transport system substrate-binding protein